MNKLEFKIEANQSSNQQVMTVTILVNGLDIIELLKEYEMPFAKKEGSEDIAGGYEGISPEALYKNLTNPEAFDLDKNEKVSLLECACGCDGCWPMKAKVIHLQDKIIWAEFEQPHRAIDSANFWDYSNFGQFGFDKNNYIEQLDKLRQAKNSLRT